MWTPLRRLSLLLAGFLLTISSVSARHDGQEPVHLFDLTTAHGVLDNRPFQPTQVFAPEDNPIYLWFRGEGCIAGTVIRSVWFYLETDPPLRFGNGTIRVDRADDWGQFNFELAPGKRWPVGMYRIELRVGDAVSAETRFQVSVDSARE